MLVDNFSSAMVESASMSIEAPVEAGAAPFRCE